MSRLSLTLDLLDQLEEALELEGTSSTPNTQREKSYLRSRLGRIVQSLPALPPPSSSSSARRDRASSEAPTPAQPPAPRSPPPLNRKASKSLRCSERAHSIYNATIKEEPLTSDDFFSALSSSPHGSMTNQENHAMAKLFVGYEAGTAESWRQSRGEVDFTSISIQNLLHEEQQYDAVSDLTDRIMLRHKNLAYQETTSDVSAYFRLLFQTVNAIEFSLEVQQLGSGKGGTARKTALYAAMHIAEGGGLSYKEWKAVYEPKVTARNKLCKVYFAVGVSRSPQNHTFMPEKFGPIMLLDMFWSPRNMEPNHRTNDFSETLDLLIKMIPHGSLAALQPSTKNALANALTLLFPGAAAHVLAFCNKNPPNIAMDDDNSDGD
ncbi:hypothetical protein C8R44DRAFT_883934 [Mycena epipterygia]|nr:hypothetical protein C8R44DRAFT_883934 [Mycena epipterygia]